MIKFPLIPNFKKNHRMNRKLIFSTAGFLAEIYESPLNAGKVPDD